MKKTVISLAGVMSLVGIIIGYVWNKPNLSIRDTNPELRIIELGDVAPNAEIKKDVPIFNTYDAELHIDFISASCGCVEKKLSKTVVPRGASANLHLSFIAPNVRGRFKHHVEIRFRNGHSQHLALSGSVGAWFSVSQSEIEFGSASIGDKILAKLSLTLHDGFDVNLQSSEITLPYARIAEVVGSGNQVTYKLEFEPDDNAAVGNHKGELRIKWEDTYRSIRVPCSGAVCSSLVAAPQRLFLGIVERNELTNSKISLSSRRGEVVDPQIELSSQLSGAIRVDWNPELSQLDVMFDSSKVPPGAIAGDISIQSLDALAVIPFSAFVD